MKINIHTVLSLAEADVERAASRGLAALISEFERATGGTVEHVESILTTDKGPRPVVPNKTAETPGSSWAPPVHEDESAA